MSNLNNFRKIKPGKLLAVNLLIFICLLITGEFIHRLLFPGYIHYRRSDPSDKPEMNVDWAKADKELGWVCKPDSFLKFSSKEYNKYNIKYKINSEGFRNKSDFGELKQDSGKGRVMLIGDSFIMSVYLNEDETIASQLGEKTGHGYTVTNLGIAGYGIDQSYLAYKKYTDILNPDYVILFYIDDDIQRVLESVRTIEGLNKPSFDIINGELKLRRKDKSSVFVYFLEESRLFNILYRKYMSYYSLDITEKIFDNLITDTRKSGQELIVIRCPTIEALLQMDDYSFYSFREYFNSKNIRYIELFEEMKLLDIETIKSYYLPGDGHPSKKGAGYFAGIIRQALN